MKKQYNLLVPMCGKGHRFASSGYTMPKPLIMVKDVHHIDLSMSSIDHASFNLIFIIRKDHDLAYNLSSLLRQKYGEDISVVVLDKDTDGSMTTCLAAEHLVNNGLPLSIYTLDVVFSPKFTPSMIDPTKDGMLLTFKSNSPEYSYAKVENGNVTETAEKLVISDSAIVGIYHFKTGRLFCEYANKALTKVLDGKERYLAPLYNSLIQDGLTIDSKSIEKIHVIGTPSELEFYMSHAYKKFGDKPIALCSDHSGLETKERMKKVLAEHNIKYIDYGTFTDKDCDQYDYAIQAVDSIRKGFCDFGIGFCRTGQGFNIAANKQKDIRSALVYNSYTAKYAVQHNCANFFAIPETDKQTLEDIIFNIRSSTFDGGRHTVRIRKIEDAFSHSKR